MARRPGQTSGGASGPTDGAADDAERRRAGGDGGGAGGDGGGASGPGSTAPVGTAAGERVSRAEQGRLLRSAGAMGGVTLLSRVFGYLRDRVLTYYLGTGLAADAWAAAFRLPNVLRRLVGEGNVSAAFIPVFSEVAERRDEERLWAFTARFYTAVMLFAAGLTLLGMATAPWWVPWFIPGFEAVLGKVELTVALTRATFPYLFFVALAAVLMAVLNARDIFAVPAFPPVLLNLSIIGCTVALAHRWMEPVTAVALGAVVGGVLQWLFLVPFAKREGMSLRPRLDLLDPALRRVLRLMLPGIVGVGVTQINILVGQFLASLVGEGAVASLYYAGRLNELTLGVFTVSVATVVLPLMSRQAAAGAFGELRHSLEFSLRQVLLVSLPSTVGLIVLRREIVAVLYRGGEFGDASIALTAGALWGYSVGLVGYAGVRILAPCFYALKDTRTPVVVAAGAMLANVALCLALMGPLAQAGIALANSLAGMANAAALLWLLRRRLQRVHGRRLLASTLRLGAASAVMGWAVHAAAGRWWPEPADLLLQAGVLALLIGGGAAVFVLVAFLLRAPELGELRDVVRPGEPDILREP